MKYLICFLLLVVGCSPATTMVPCIECGGSGQVVYDEDHPIVQLGAKPGTYTCPMCGGEGELVEESR